MAIYDAFISYSHAKDKPIAAALQSVDAEARQAVVPAPRAARLPRRYQPVGDAGAVAVDRAGARAIALSDPAGIAGGGGVALGQ